MTSRRFVLLAICGALMTLGGLWLARGVSAQELALTVSVPRLSVGEEQSASLDAADMGAGGLGAWTIDITYDPDLLEPTLCESGGFSVCNIAFAADTVRLAGASTEPFPAAGTLALATIRFTCLAPGEARLTVLPRTLVDQSLAEPQPIDASVQSASFVCEEEGAQAPPPAAAPTPTVLPIVGAGGQPGSDDLMRALISVLSGVGIAALITFALLLMRARRL